MQEFLQIFIGDKRHLDHDKAGSQSLVQFSRSGIAVVHGSDKTRSRVKPYLVVSGNIDAPAVIQRFVKNCQGFIFRHIDFIQYPETAKTGASAHRTFPENYFSVSESIRAYQGSGVRMDAQRNIPHGASECRRQIFREYIFPGGLWTGQEQIFAAEQG